MANLRNSLLVEEKEIFFNVGNYADMVATIDDCGNFVIGLPAYSLEGGKFFLPNDCPKNC